MTFTKHNECSSKGRKHFINKNIYKTHQLSKSNSTNPHSYNQLNKLSKKKNINVQKQTAHRQNHRSTKIKTYYKSKGNMKQ
jgi:hypothetical protein